NGATGAFIACTGEAPGTNRFELSMDGGQLLLEDGRLLLRRTAVPVSRFIREYPGGYGTPEITQEDITPDAEYSMHAGVTRAFARHILYGEPMIADGREGLNALELANAMLLSSAEERTLELPFDAETDARYEKLLEGRAACSREKTAKDVQMNLGKSY
ncbi:MAG: gfo/Idh/MocA family oxidoreductase, partial [Candidatus Ventricola sp.]|nr:gfo/Idh/MocA family oxidoreductase [Candidatus Ventricola sp.]